MHRKIEIVNHACRIDGKDRILITADYPYYRDKVALWPKKLAALKGLGMDAVTFYVPWRHHARLVKGRQVFDFTGETLPNRDVVGFLGLVEKAGLLAVVKPGPFIHAETDHGGLPPYVIPGHPDCDCDAQERADGTHRTWLHPHWPMPSPTGRRFMRLVEEWFRAVDRELLAGRAYPKGPVMALQICNEGLFTDAGEPPTAFDYAPDSIALFRRWLKETYGTVSRYNRCHGTALRSFVDVPAPRSNRLGAKTSGGELLALMDWRRYQARYTAHVIGTYNSFLSPCVPRVTNSALHYKNDHHLDYWICRNSYYGQAGVHQGFTNWVGAVSVDRAAFDKYLIAIKHNKGINWEENWGFSKLYDSRYAFPVVPYYQTLLALACGAKGFNVYTGVATSSWDSHIDSKHERPYPDTPPIDDRGEESEKAFILKELTRYLKSEERDLVRARCDSSFTYVMDLPTSAAGSFEENRFSRLAHVHGAKSFMNLVTICREGSIGFELHNASCEDARELERARTVVLPSCFFMSRPLQQSIAGMIRAGRTVLWFGELPEVDERFEPCTILREAAANAPAGVLRRIGGLAPVTAARWKAVLEATGIRPRTRLRDPFYLQRFTVDRETSFYYLFAMNGRNHEVRLDLPEGRLEANLTDGSALMFKVKRGRIVSALVKSLNEMKGRSMPVKLLLDGKGFRNRKAKDGVLSIADRG